MMMRPSLGLIAALLSLPVMAGIDGIWLCSSTDNAGGGMESGGYFAVNANGNAAIMAPLAVGDYYNVSAMIGYAVLSQMAPDRHAGFGFSPQISALVDVGATVGADGMMSVTFVAPPNVGGTRTALTCKKIW